MKILVTGGAGYIGSFMSEKLLERGDEVVIVDDLERGHKEKINPKAKFYQGDFLDKIFVSELFRENKFDGVIHFAGYISMGESMENPYIYFQNNVFSSLNILEEMIKSNTNNFIFSSTAGVYGNPIKLPISEDHPKNPTNPYGESKLIVERIMDWYSRAHGLNSVALRYFNAAGASLDGQRGEDHNPETHIIPKIIEAILKGQKFKLFGTDYDTTDGTCVRDYIHVLDLVDAHILALEELQKNNNKHMNIYNVGTGKGYSNREVIRMVEKISDKVLQIEEMSRRLGDADTLIADATRIGSELGFNPKYSDLETIVKTAWQWHKNNLK